jgi:hypothetical protein
MPLASLRAGWRGPDRRHAQKRRHNRTAPSPFLCLSILHDRERVPPVALVAVLLSDQLGP